MSSILTFSIYSLRVSSDIPVQSEYLPIIGYYFIFAISFILVSFIWFITLNKFAEKKKMPQFLIKIAEAVRMLCCLNDKTKSNVKPIGNDEKKAVDKNEIIVVKNDAENNIEKVELKQLNKTSLDKCNKCDLCTGCSTEKDKEEKKKKEKEILDANLNALNLLAFFIILTATLAVNLSIWISISI